jgi:hypothetical protein
MAADGLAGTLTRTEKEEQNPFKTTPSARRVPGKRAGPPQRHEFVPTIFHRQFSASNPRYCASGSAILRHLGPVVLSGGVPP